MYVYVFDRLRVSNRRQQQQQQWRQWQQRVKRLKSIEFHIFFSNFSLLRTCLSTTTFGLRALVPTCTTRPLRRHSSAGTALSFQSFALFYSLWVRRNFFRLTFFIDEFNLRSFCCFSTSFIVSFLRLCLCICFVTFACCLCAYFPCQLFYFQSSI